MTVQSRALASSASRWRDGRTGFFALLIAATALAEPVPRHLPLRFQVDAGPVRTSVCAEVTEHVYGVTAWWKAIDPAADPRQRALQAVIDAINRQDVKGLEALTSAAGAPESEYRQQMQLMLKQSSFVSSIDAVQMYEVGPVLVAFARMHVNDKVGYANLLFTKDGDRYWFRAAKPRYSAFVLLRDWVDSPWGLVDSQAPGYCSSDEIARANTRVSFSSPRDFDIGGATPIALKLEHLSGPSGHVQGTASRVVARFVEMEEAARKDQRERLFSYMSTRESEELRRGMSDPQSAGQWAQLRAMIVGQKPIALVDGGPLFVLYTRADQVTPGRVWYFIAESAAAPQWVNFSRLTQLDPIFKSGPIFEAATGKGPTP